MTKRSKWSVKEGVMWELNQIKGIDCWLVDLLVFDGLKWRIKSTKEFSDFNEATKYYEAQTVNP